MGTHYKGSEKEIDALNSYVKLIRAAETVSSRINNSLTKKGLTESQFGILEALYHLGPLCQKDLGKKLLRSGGNITLVVDNLEKQGFVKRERGESDRRYFTVHLTEKGTTLTEEIFPHQLKLIVEEMSVLSEKENAEFQALCKKIGIKDLPDCNK